MNKVLFYIYSKAIKPFLIKIWISVIGEDRYYLKRFPFNVPTKTRFENTHIMATIGHGKTQLLMQMIYRDLLSLEKGHGGLCLIDSQGDLIDTIRNLDLFSPSRVNGLSDRLVIIDPTDIDYPPSINLFDIDIDSIEKLNDPALKETLINSTLSLYSYMFDDLVDGSMTMYQNNLYSACSNLLMRIPGANLQTFLDLLRNPDQFQSEFHRLDDLSKRFFFEEFNSKKYAATKDQVATRLWSLLFHSTFKRMLTSQKNKVDMFKMMNEGKIILINTSKALLQEERCRMLGKFFIGMFLQSALRRGAIPEKMRRPYFLYIDEAFEYLNGGDNTMMMTLLAQGRKYKVGCILAHQYLEQISQATRAGILSNTSMKIYGKVENADADFLSRRIGVDSKEMIGLEKKEGKESNFLAHMRGLKAGSIKFKIPIAFINNKKNLSSEDRKVQLEYNRSHYCEKKKEEQLGYLPIVDHLKNIPNDIKL